MTDQVDPHQDHQEVIVLQSQVGQAVVQEEVVHRQEVLQDQVHPKVLHTDQIEDDSLAI